METYRERESESEREREREIEREREKQTSRQTTVLDWTGRTAQDTIGQPCNDPGKRR